MHAAIGFAKQAAFSMPNWAVKGMNKAKQFAEGNTRRWTLEAAKRLRGERSALRPIKRTNRELVGMMAKAIDDRASGKISGGPRFQRSLQSLGDASLIGQSRALQQGRRVHTAKLMLNEAKRRSGARARGVAAAAGMGALAVGGTAAALSADGESRKSDE